MRTVTTSASHSSTTFGISSMRIALLAAGLVGGANFALAAPAGSGLTTYADLPSFLAATSGTTLSFEDFAAHDSHNVSPCYEPVNRDAGQPATSFLEPVCFHPGDVISGFDIRSDLDWTSGITTPWGPMTGPGLFFIGRDSMSPGPASNTVGATYSAATKTFVDFRDGPVAVAMDAYDIAAGSPVTIDAYAAGGTLIGSFTVFPTAPTSPSFAGFTSTVPVQRIALHSASAVSQIIGNLRFGGTAGRLEANVQSVDFGALAVGSSVSQSIAVSNAGNTDVAVDPITAPSAPFAIASDACSGTTLPAGASCSLSVEFAPALERRYASALDIQGNGTASHIGLSARGVLPAFSSSPTAVDFGTIAPGQTSGPVAVTIANTTAVALDVGTIDAPDAPFALAGGGSCATPPLTLAPGQSCTLMVSFSPTEAGVFNARVVVGSNDPSSPGEILLRGAAGDTIFVDGFDG